MPAEGSSNTARYESKRKYDGRAQSVLPANILYLEHQSKTARPQGTEETRPTSNNGSGAGNSVAYTHHTIGHSEHHTYIQARNDKTTTVCAKPIPVILLKPVIICYTQRSIHCRTAQANSPIHRAQALPVPDGSQ